MKTVPSKESVMFSSFNRNILLSTTVLNDGKTEDCENVIVNGLKNFLL